MVSPQFHMIRVVVAMLVSVSACAEPSTESAGRLSDSRDGVPGADWAAQREAMVRFQIESRGVSDSAVLGAMRRVPRHLFVPEAERTRSYEDTPLPIGHGQTISQPYIVALMTSLLDLSGEEKILEVGTGSGYQAAVLAEIVDSVFTIEIIEPLAQQAGKILDSLGYADRVRVRIGDGYEGWEDQAPFDCVIVTCAPREIPPPLVEQLKEGGRLVIPYGRPWFQELALAIKKDGDIHRQKVLPVRFVPLTGPHAED